MVLLLRAGAALKNCFGSQRVCLTCRLRQTTSHPSQLIAATPSASNPTSACATSSATLTSSASLSTPLPSFHSLHFAILSQLHNHNTLLSPPSIFSAQVSSLLLSLSLSFFIPSNLDCIILVITTYFCNSLTQHRHLCLLSTAPLLLLPLVCLFLILSIL